MTQLAADFAGTARFQVLARLGAGGMGVVYDVFDRERKSRVALKTLRTLGGVELMRFKNEFRALSDLHHINLVSLGELIHHDGLWFFTMELIDGWDLLSHARPNGKLDVERLQSTFLQLAEGLGALHAAGKVHRDIKPSNVRVTQKGRVVLLDLGLVTDAQTPGTARTSSDQVVGTATYMSPEQAQSKPVTAAADWYSVGVVLYEALTGDVPFAGSPLDVLMRKQVELPRPPRQLAPDVPADLETLCLRLLAVDPAVRPTTAEVMAALAPGATPTTVRAASSSSQPIAVAPPFVGRAGELGALEDAFLATRDGRSVAVIVRGESGVGKSALVKRFAEQAASRGAVVLAGRCYERESVPYKALDGVIDALTNYMVRIDRAEAAALLPAQTALLATAFPVLLRVEAVARSPKPASEVRDPLQLRARVFAAVRELLARLADRRPLVVIIDDLQWADADSLALLAEILRPPDAPALLCVAIVRTDGGIDLDALARELGDDVRALAVGGLMPAEARELVQLLAADAGAPLTSEMVSSIGSEAAGHPLFIDEMVRHAVAQPGRPKLRLDEALWARLQRLPDDQRRIVALSATAGAPLWLETMARAAGLEDMSRFADHVAALRAQRLVRTSGQKRRDTLEPYHDRVREAMTAHLGDDERRDLHDRLARALEWSGQFDPEAASAHWQGAGQADKAARYAAIAAARASQALAFDRAADLYRRSLALREPEGAEGRSLRVKLAEALGSAGRGPEAAAAFLEAKRGASEAEAFELQLRAADQFLRSGHIDEGLDAIKTVLDGLGVKMPSATPTRALTAMLMTRARLRLRGLSWSEREASTIDPRTMARIDATWSVAVALGTVDTIRGADFQTRNLILALNAGEPYRIARALTMEAAYVATAGGPGHARASKLLEVGRELSERIEHPHAIGWSRLAAGFSAFLSGRWREARPWFSEAESIFRERCSGCAWELDSVDLFSLWTRYYLGELGELGRLLPSRVQEATARGDRYGVTNLRARVAHVIALVGDDPTTAEREATEAVAAWSHTGFHAQHYYQLFAQAEADLYRGDAAAAAESVGTRWPALHKSLLLQVQFIRLEALHLRARTQLAAARFGGGIDHARVQAALADARRIERARMPWATPLATLVRAGAAALGDDAARAASLCELAARELDGAGMALYATVARWRLGHIIGGGDGYALVTAANEWMQTQKVREPRRLAAVLAPGFPD